MELFYMFWGQKTSQGVICFHFFILGKLGKLKKLKKIKNKKLYTKMRYVFFNKIYAQLWTGLY